MEKCHERYEEFLESIQKIVDELEKIVKNQDDMDHFMEPILRESIKVEGKLRKQVISLMINSAGKRIETKGRIMALNELLNLAKSFQDSDDESLLTDMASYISQLVTKLMEDYIEYDKNNLLRAGNSVGRCSKIHGG